MFYRYQCTVCPVNICEKCNGKGVRPENCDPNHILTIIMAEVEEGKVTKFQRLAKYFLLNTMATWLDPNFVHPWMCDRCSLTRSSSHTGCFTTKIQK